MARPINATIDRMLSLKLTGRAHAYVRLALYRALRVHEIAKIRAEDFDFESGWLLVTGKGGITKPIPTHSEVAKLGELMPACGYWSHRRRFPMVTSTRSRFPQRSRAPWRWQCPLRPPTNSGTQQQTGCSGR